MFKHKTVTNIIIDILDFVMSHIFSKEHKGLINSRGIKDWIFLTSKAINILNNKCFRRNVARKIDISKAFDTLNWQFLLKVLNFFVFSRKLSHLIQMIHQSNFLSISINSRQINFFNFQIYGGHGDPLSSLLFYLVEEVLSRGVS